MSKFTLSAISSSLVDVLDQLSDNAVEEDTLVGFDDNLQPVVGDVGTQPLVAWVRVDDFGHAPYIEVELSPEVTNRQR